MKFKVGEPIKPKCSGCSQVLYHAKQNTCGPCKARMMAVRRFKERREVGNEP